MELLKNRFETSKTCIIIRTPELCNEIKKKHHKQRLKEGKIAQ